VLHGLNKHCVPFRSCMRSSSCLGCGTAQHLGARQQFAFDPVFNWNNERAAVVGQRLPIHPLVFNSV